MDWLQASVILLLCVLLIWWLYVPVEYYKSDIDGLNYKIVSSFHDKTHKDAADHMAKINIFIIDLMRHLKGKYMRDNAEPIRRHIVYNLLQRYNIDALRENNPSSTRDTSFVLNKGDEIAFCLRKKHSSDEQFHEIETMKFIILHELAHLGLDSYGHGQQFWRTFHFLTHEAKEAGLYEPIDYGNNNMIYCGVRITHNPYFHPNLTL